MFFIFIFFIFFFFQKIGFDISCKLPPKETICMKCQSIFSGEKKEKNTISLSSAEFAQRVIEVKYQSRFMNAFICHKIKKVISFYSSN